MESDTIRVDEPGPRDTTRWSVKTSTQGLEDGSLLCATGTRITVHVRCEVWTVDGKVVDEGVPEAEH